MVLRVLGIGTLILAASSPSTASTVESVRACMERNAPQRSAVYVLRIDVADAFGGERQVRAKLYWRRAASGESRLLVRVTHPEDVRGSTLLALETADGDRTFQVYLPEIGAVRNVGAAQLQGSILESDLGLDELRILIDPGGFEVALLESGPLDGRATWLLEARPEERDETGLGWAAARIYVDRDWCIPMRAEFLDAGGEIRKELRVEARDVERVAGRPLARRFRVKDRESGSQTQVLAESVEIDIPIAPSLLTIHAPGGD